MYSKKHISNPYRDPFTGDLPPYVDTKDINFINDSSSPLLNYINKSHHKNNSDKLINEPVKIRNKKYFPRRADIFRESIKKNPKKP
jgi:hypothetical protein